MQYPTHQPLLSYSSVISSSFGKFPCHFIKDIIGNFDACEFFVDYFLRIEMFFCRLWVGFGTVIGFEYA